VRNLRVDKKVHSFKIKDVKMKNEFNWLIVWYNCTFISTMQLIISRVHKIR